MIKHSKSLFIVGVHYFRGIVCVLLLIAASPLQAGDVFWQLSSPATGTWLTPSNWSTLSLPTSADRAFIINDGTATIGSGSVDVLEIVLGATLSGTLSQSGGTVDVDQFNIDLLGVLDFTSGSLTVGSQFNLFGTFDVTGSSGSFVAEDNSFIDFSQGTLLGSGGMSFTGGVGSTLLLPQGVDPNVFFSSFSTQGDVFNVSGTKLIVPFGFTLDITGDRPDLIRVEGILQPEGSPASPQSLTFDEGGVEVAPGGLFDMHGASLTLRTDSSVIGGELRDVGTFTIADRTDDDITFTQSSGTTDINGSVRIGYATAGSSNPHGTFNMDGGSLSIGGTMSVGTGNQQSFTSVFSEGTFRQTAGTTSVGSSLIVANQRFATGGVELLGGTVSVGGNVTLASGMDSDGTLILAGATLDVTGDVTVGRSAGNSTGQLTQNDGDFSLNAITVYSGSRYDLTGGTLTIGDRFDLTGIFDFGGGNATITLADNGVVEWSTGTLTGVASSTNYTAGVDSQSFFPAGFNPFTPDYSPDRFLDA